MGMKLAPGEPSLAEKAFPTFRAGSIVSG